MNKKLTFHEKITAKIREYLPDEKDRADYETLVTQVGKLREKGDQAIKDRNGIFEAEVAWGHAVFPLCQMSNRLLESIAGGIQDVKNIEVEEINKRVALKREYEREYRDLKGPSGKLTKEQLKAASINRQKAKKLMLSKIKKLDIKSVRMGKNRDLKRELSKINLLLRALPSWIASTFPYDPGSVPSHMNRTLNPTNYSLLDQIDHVKLAIEARAKRIEDRHVEKLEKQNA